MNRKWLGICVAAAMGTAAPSFGQSGVRKLVEIATTEHVPFQAGGTLHLNGSFGDLSVEGWDRPEVEITLTKTLDNLYDPSRQADAAKLAERVHVTAERRSDTDLEINTTVPHYSRWTHPFGSNGGVMLTWRIRAPRQTKLEIRHRDGGVFVQGIVSDIEAAGRAGDIVLILPEPETEHYTIDAKTRIGGVYSDFAGERRRTMTGLKYALAGSAPVRRVQLRMGVGGITIKGSPAAAQPPATPSVQ